MTTLQKWAGVLALVAILLAITAMFFPKQVAQVVQQVGATGTRFPNGLSTDSTSPSAGQLRTTTLTVTGASTIGTSGTSLNGIITGSCTIWSPADIITASTTQQAVCQSATDGSLGSGLTGVTADSICHVRHASSTSVLGLGLGVGGTSASSTAGNIITQIQNFTGADFNWNAVASSSEKWKYSCFDPA